MSHAARCLLDFLDWSVDWSLVVSLLRSHGINNFLEHVQRRPEAKGYLGLGLLDISIIYISFANY